MCKEKIMKRIHIYIDQKKQNAMLGTRAEPNTIVSDKNDERFRALNEKQI